MLAIPLILASVSVVDTGQTMGKGRKERRLGEQGRGDAVDGRKRE